MPTVIIGTDPVIRSQSPFSGQTFRAEAKRKEEISNIRVTKPFQRADFPSRGKEKGGNLQYQSHKALSAGRLSEGTLGIPRPYRAKIAISTKLNFFPKKYSRKVTKIILNPRRFVLSAIYLFQMYLIPDCYRTFNDFTKFSKFKISKISEFVLNFRNYTKIFLKNFSTSFPKIFLDFSWKIFSIAYC